MARVDTLTSIRQVPHGALALERARVVRDGAVHGEALVETKREGHRGLAGWLSVEGYGAIHKAWREGMRAFSRLD